MEPEGNGNFAEPVKWSPAPPRFRPLRLALSLLVGAAAVWVAALLLPGVHVQSFGAALIAAALVGVLNAILPPIVAALRLPFTLVLGFLAVLAVDAAILLLVSDIASPDIKVDSFGWALLAALLIAAASMALQTILGVNDEDSYSLRVIERVARRQGDQTRTDAPGIVFLEIDGLAAPVLRRAMRDGNAPVLARWLEEGADRRESGRHLARLKPRHSGVPLGRERDGQAHDLLRPRRLRRDRASPGHWQRPARGGWGQPWESAIRRGGRGDPDRQPDGC
jgi:uncharacterized membrane protein YvlD (DUF360 family)